MDDNNIDLTKNAEIQNALREFEIKNAEEEAKRIPVKKEPESSKLAHWIMKHSGGAVKEERQAEYVMLVFVVVCLGVSAFLFFTGGAPSNEKIIPPMPVAGEGDPNFIP
ncbi:MAG: hypothetical protein WAV15_01825 [Minisyncoccia bacterium]